MGGEEGAKISWAQGRKVPKYGPGYDHVEKVFIFILFVVKQNMRGKIIYS